MFKYLRVSVTDRCNYRCVYCMPEDGICKETHDTIMRYEEMLPVIRAAVETGVEQVRVTGGEPLVRAGIVDFVGELAKISGLKDLTLTTNGALLDRFAEPLKKAGLKRVNISVDSLDPENFIRITRNGNLSDVLRGIDAAVTAGLGPVKINTVLIPKINDHEILAFADFAVKKGLSVRFIERMPFNADPAGEPTAFISEETVLAAIKARYQLEPYEEPSFGPAHNYRIVGTEGRVGFISSRTAPFCHLCQRLRLTSGGYLLPCLDSQYGVNIRGMNSEEVKAVIARLFSEKASWRKNRACFAATFDNSLSKIGG
ncbi:MAG TPA: GTP 3',8-cyclase MoaA [Candidatus Ozemobacteraceae bacterium]|nr:GTP 3',8-cyclase MoaA [Candidatus Ozemobacteraceae bacterium]